MSGTSVDNYVFTEEEMKVYNEERMNIYHGTITVCAIYAGIAFLIILLGYFTEWGRSFLLGTILPFVITYIIGSIVIIIILADWVAKFKPRKIDDRVGYDSDICPDYWHLAENDTSGEPYSKDVNQHLMKYKCVYDPKIIDKNTINASDPRYKFTNSDDKDNELPHSNEPEKSHLYVNLNDDSANAPTTKENLFGGNGDKKMPLFKDYAMLMHHYKIREDKPAVADNTKTTKYNYDDYVSLATPEKTLTINDGTTIDGSGVISKTKTEGEVPLTCDTVYPLYLSAMDIHNSELNRDEPKNVFRCAYAKACGFPWTDAGCN